MKKVVYSVTKFTKDNLVKVKGLGYITDTDLITAQKKDGGNPYVRIYENCLKDCHPVINTPDTFKGCFYEVHEYEGHDYQTTYAIWYKLADEVK